MIVPLIDLIDEFEKKEQERKYFTDLIFNSHKWVEFREGLYKCEFCSAKHSSYIPFEYNYFCPSNPYIKVPK